MKKSKIFADNLVSESISWCQGQTGYSDPKPRLFQHGTGNFVPTVFLTYPNLC